MAATDDHHHHPLRLALEQFYQKQQEGDDDEDDPFAPIPRLDDIALPSSHIHQYASKHDLNPPLSARLHRLWLERGDFSKFKRSSLSLNTPPHDPAIDIPTTPPATEDTSAEEQPLPHLQQVTISAHDAETLKANMLHRIGNAHFATYFIHNLVALLLQQQSTQRKLDLEQQSALAQSQVQILSTTGNNSKQQQRGGTPLTDISEGTSSAAAALQQQQQQRGEPYFDPKILGLSEVFPDPHTAATTAKPFDIDDDDEDDDDNAPQPPSTHGDQHYTLDRTPLAALATTRATLTRASDILRKGASSIRRVAGSGSTGEGTTPIASETRRWTGLQQLRLSAAASGGGGGTHWNLSPTPQNVGLGSALWWGGLSAREDGEGAGAKDAWIGYGLPEVRPRLRKNALAFFADDDVVEPAQRAADAATLLSPVNPALASSSSTSRTTITTAAGPLVFWKRTHRRLRVRLIGPDGVSLQHATAPASSDPSDTSLEQELRLAQDELLDEELWAQLFGERLSSAGGTKQKKKKKRKKDQEQEGEGEKGDAGAAVREQDSVQIPLAGGSVLVLDMVSTGPGAAAPASQQEASSIAADLAPPQEEKSDQPNSDPSASPSSPTPLLPRIILAYLRLSLLRSIRLRLAAGAAKAAPATAAGASSSQAASAPPANVAATAVGGDAGEKSKGAENQLDPILGLFRYTKFIGDVEQVLRSLGQEGGSGEASKVWYRIAPLASLSSSLAWLRLLLVEEAENGGGGAAGEKARPMDAVKMLSGTGTVFLDAAPLALITMAYPARLRVQFCNRAAPRWTEELSLDVFRTFVTREVRAGLRAS